MLIPTARSARFIVSFELKLMTTHRAPSSFSSTSIARKSAIRSAPPNSPAIRSCPVKNDTSPQARVASKSKAQSTIDVAIRPRSEFQREERKLLSFLSSKELKLRRNFREIQNLEGPEKPGSERHRAPESPEILKIASNGTISMESPPEPP